MNQRISDTVSDLITYLFLSEEETCEVISTEDFLSRIEQFNQSIREGKIDTEEIMVGSLDVEALYPSIDIDCRTKSPMTKSPLTKSLWTKSPPDKIPSG